MKQDTDTNGRLSGSEPACGDSIRNQRLFQASSTLLASEIASQLAWRLQATSLTLGALVITGALYYGVRERALAYAWLICAMLDLTSFELFRKETKEEIFHFASYAAFAGVLWWLLIPLFGIGPSYFAEMALMVLLVGKGTVPLPKRINVIHGFVLFCAVLQQLFSSTAPLLFFCLAVMILLISVRTSAVSYLDLMSRVLQPLLVKASETYPSVISTIRLLVWYASMAADTEAGLIISGFRRSEVVVNGKTEESQVDEVYLRGLALKVRESNANDGILSIDHLGEQYISPLYDWFGFFPGQLYFSSLRAVLDDQEQEICIFVPVSYGARIVGISRVQRCLIGMVSAVRIATGATRTRFLSSDVLSASERSISEKEQEINQLIHLVNNVAQEISIINDTCREAVAEISSLVHPGLESGSGLSPVSKMFEQMDQLELVVRNLSSGVSDLKWLKELMQLKSYARTEIVDLNQIVPEIVSYGQYRAERKGMEFTAVNDLNALSGAEVAGREFLEASVRHLLRLGEKRAGPGGKFKLHISNEGNEVVFRVSDNGTPLSERDRINLISTGKDYRIDSNMEYLLKGVVNFARLSGGRCLFVEPEYEAGNTIAIKLKGVVVKERGVLSSGKWVLLVDDKEQIITFYARVAEALELQYETAGSVEEAERVVEERGIPHLVVTDIQLGERSGLELVKDLRAKYGGDIPIIVVSGYTEVGIAEQVYAAGATKYLTKPVSRGKLFSEINTMLSS